MSLILQIETATTVCSVALAQNGNVIALKEVNERNVHAEMITLFIRDVMKKSDKQLQDLDAVAVSKGPGSYTGLRIGVSTAKGLCFALDKPLIAINTLEAMASGALVFGNEFDADALLCPMIDARRMEVYMSLITIEGETIKHTTAEIIDENTFSEIADDRQIIIFGDGSQKCREMLAGKKNVVLLPQFINSATQLTQRAADKFAKQDFENIAYFEPYYLKEFIAGKKPVS